MCTFDGTGWSVPVLSISERSDSGSSSSQGKIFERSIDGLRSCSEGAAPMALGSGLDVSLDGGAIDGKGEPNPATSSMVDYTAI